MEGGRGCAVVEALVSVAACFLFACGPSDASASNTKVGLSPIAVIRGVCVGTVLACTGNLLNTTRW